MLAFKFFEGSGRAFRRPVSHRLCLGRGGWLVGEKGHLRFIDDVAGTNGGRTFQAVAQFANVPRPRVFLHPASRFDCDIEIKPVESLTINSEEVIDKTRNVAAPLA